MAVHVNASMLAVELDGDVRTIQRTTEIPVRNLKASKPHEVPDGVWAHRQTTGGT